MEHILTKQFLLFMKNHQLLNYRSTYLLAVSGGLDSMVMAHLFKEATIKMAIAHCNYGLRGKDSDLDEMFVEKWSKDNHITYFVKQTQLNLDGESIQLAARKIRYTWFNELKKKYGYYKIVTAHHLNDSFETTLINLIRGTGVKGLGGIPISSKHVIRPLIFATKDQLLDYATTNNIEWRKDTTNEKNDYVRNCIRHKIIPELSKLNTSLLSTFKRTSERLKLTSRLLEEMTQKTIKKYIKKNDNHLLIDIRWVTTPVDELLFSEILSAYGYNYNQTKKIIGAIGKSGKQFITNEWIGMMDRTVFYLLPNKISKTYHFQIGEEGNYHLLDKTIIVSKHKNSNIKVDFKNSSVAYIDADILSFPLTIRHWKKGDAFRPLGMKGRKKISDFLVDEKIPLALKSNILILTNEKNNKEEVVWVINHRISDQYKLTTLTKNVIKIEFFNKK